VSNVQDFLRLRDEARVLIPTLGKFPIVLQDGSEISWEHFNVANLPQYNVPLGFDVIENQRLHLVAYHEPGHEEEERLSRQDPLKKHRQAFLTLIGETQSWDSLKAAADAETAAGHVQQGHDLDPGEWWADAFANAIAGLPKVGPFKVQNTDPLKLRAFFQSLAGVAPQPSLAPVAAVSGKGCDIASYQGTVNFDVLRTEVAFVIAKSTEGTGYKDPTFPRNWAESKRVGLTRGAYHFARPDLGTNAQDEAAYFLSALGPVDPGDLLALDYEVQWAGDVVGWCKAWLDLVYQMTGIKAFIYLNLSLVRNHNWAQVIAAGYPLWLASYDGQPDAVPSTPWPSVAIKQWTSSGTLQAVHGNVDLNTAFGGGDMTEAEVLAIIEKNYGLTNTVAAVKNALEGQNAAIVKLANDETLDDTEVAALTARIDKLKTI
jgi:GH25 family lysozyme M1 (1,4-beta-N-acetylmuramidase)